MFGSARSGVLPALVSPLVGDAGATAGNHRLRAALPVR
jgi:hypothetical protein